MAALSLFAGTTMDMSYNHMACRNSEDGHIMLEIVVREDGHIMLSDFDLSLQCVVSPTLIRAKGDGRRGGPAYCIQPACVQPSCIQPSCVVQPSCLLPRFLTKSKSKKNNTTSNGGSSSRKVRNDAGNQVSPLPELVAEPTGARSMSFVGTHDYLAPEIIKGEGHGSAVDWWTFGIFLYELLHGKTPFKGSGNRATLFNVVGQPLKFPETSHVSFAARDLIRGLLVKDPQHRLASKRGASEIKQHPFFDGINWALIRSTAPPEIPKPPEDLQQSVLLPTTKLATPAAAASGSTNGTSSAGVVGVSVTGNGTTSATTTTVEKKVVNGGDPNGSGSYLDFDFF